MRRSLAIAWVVMGLGCGNDGGPPSISANQDNVCDQIAAVGCYDMYRCCAEGERERFLGVSDPRTEAECRDDLRRLCERRIATVTFSIAHDRIRFDSEIMNTCLQSLLVPDDTCATVDSMLPWTEACVDSAWVGTVANGTSCDYTYECASADSYCSSGRVCTAKPGNGQPCGAGCASGFYCNGGTCAPLLGAGSPCASTTQCTKGLFCDTSTPQPTCTPLHNAGEACTGPASCVTNNCLPGTCEGTTQICYSKANCAGHCEGNNAFCVSDNNCSSGACSIGGAFCSTPADCTGAGNTCVYTIKCVPGTCTGNVVCADAHVTVDYCTGAINGLPLPK